MKRELFYDEPMNTSFGDSQSTEQGDRNNVKLSPKSIEFDMKKDESLEMFGRMVEQLHKRGITFTIQQDFNLIWICL